MILKQYQRRTLDVVRAYFAALDVKTPEEAYRTEGGLDVRGQLDRMFSSGA